MSLSFLWRTQNTYTQCVHHAQFSDVNVPVRDKLVPTITEWRVRRLRMEERPPICRVAANISNKQPRTADNGWYSSLGIGRGANNSSPLKRIMLLNVHTESLGPGLIIWYDLSDGKWTWDLVQDNIKMDLQEVGCAGMDWIELAQDRDR